MAAETSALPYVEESAERVKTWVREGAGTVARNPGYLLITAAVAGFVVGRVVKGLLSSLSGGSDERHASRK